MTGEKLKSVREDNDRSTIIPHALVIVSDRPKKVWVFEVAISHLQNVKVQEKVKRAPYAINSTVHVTHTNYDSVPRSINLV